MKKIIKYNLRTIPDNLKIMSKRAVTYGYTDEDGTGLPNEANRKDYGYQWFHWSNLSVSVDGDGYFAASANLRVGNGTIYNKYVMRVAIVIDDKSYDLTGGFIVEKNGFSRDFYVKTSKIAFKDGASHSVGLICLCTHCYPNMSTAADWECYRKTTTSIKAPSAKPDDPTVSVSFVNTTSAAATNNSNGTDSPIKGTTVFRALSETSSETNNVSALGFSVGTGSKVAKLGMQYYHNNAWQNFSHALSGIYAQEGGQGYTNQWVKFTSGTHTLRREFIPSDRQYKFRIWMECSGEDSSSPSANSIADCDPIEFSVNQLPEMVDSDAKLRCEQGSVTASNDIKITWGEMKYDKDVWSKNFQLRFAKWNGSSYGNYIGTGIPETIKNAKEVSLKFSDMGVTGGTKIKFRLQASDGLEFSPKYYYGAEVLYNTPPVLEGSITSTVDTTKIFVDNVTFTIPLGSDADGHSLKYYLEKQVAGGEWVKYPNSTDSYSGREHTINCSTQVNSVEGRSFRLRARAYDGYAYSGWVYSNTITKNYKPVLTGDITDNTPDSKKLFVKNVTFTIPTATDKDSSQTIKYYLETNAKVSGGADNWKPYPNNTSSYSGTVHTIDCDSLVGSTEGKLLRLRARAHDGLEYSGWVYSSYVKRNTRPLAPTLYAPKSGSTVFNRTSRILMNIGKDADDSNMVVHVEINGTKYDSKTNTSDFCSQYYKNNDKIVFRAVNGLALGRNNFTVKSHDGYEYGESINFTVINERPACDFLESNPLFIFGKNISDINGDVITLHSSYACTSTLDKPNFNAGNVSTASNLNSIFSNIDKCSTDINNFKSTKFNTSFAKKQVTSGSNQLKSDLKLAIDRILSI